MKDRSGSFRANDCKRDGLSSEELVIDASRSCALGDTANSCGLMDCGASKKSSMMLIGSLSVAVCISAGAKSKKSDSDACLAGWGVAARRAPLSVWNFKTKETIYCVL